MRLPFLQVQLSFQAKLRDESYVGELINRLSSYGRLLYGKNTAAKPVKVRSGPIIFPGNSGLVSKV